MHRIQHLESLQLSLLSASTEPKCICADPIRARLIPRIQCEDERLGKDSREEFEISRGD